MRYESYMPAVIVLFLLCVAMSDTVAGFCLRATCIVPLVWFGVITEDTAMSLVVY
jgi:hypothetical protein